jgi:hypothetical protein
LQIFAFDHRFVLTKLKAEKYVWINVFNISHVSDKQAEVVTPDSFSVSLITSFDVDLPTV